MKTIYKAICLCVAVSCLFSCKKESAPVSGGNEDQLVDMTFSAGEDAGSKTIIQNGTDVYFQETDAISIINADGNTEFTAKKPSKYESDPWPMPKADFVGQTTVTEPYYAVYPYTEDAAISDGNITGVVIPAEQAATEATFDPKANASVCKATASKHLNFLNVGAYFEFKTDKDYDKVVIISNTTEPIAGTVTVNPETGVVVACENVVNKVTVTNVKAGKTYYAVVLPAAMKNGISVQCFNGTESAGTVVTNASLTTNRAKIKKLGTIKPTPVPPYETIPGDYSISLTQKVRFAKGNLQYQASTGKWRFAEHQWIAYRATADGGNTTSSGRDSQEKWIDMFGWGATGVDGNTAPYLASKKESDYLAADLSVSGNKADWGYVVSGNKSDYWFTLSRDEWTFLAERENREQSTIKTEVSYAWITVEGYDGFIYFPDGWKKSDWPSDVPEPTYFNNSDKSRGTYTAAQFQKLEDKGIVFFPATDYRDGTSINKYGSNTYGYYWTRTLGGVSSGYQTGNSFAIGSGRNPLSGAVVGPNIPRDHNLLITYGHAVRLVMIPKE